MQLNEIFTSGIYARLKRIQYNSESTKDKHKLSTKDDFSVMSLTEKEIDLLVSREVVLELNQGYKLRVEVAMKRTALKGVNLTTILNEDFVQQNIAEICDPIMNYMSLLISQITSSFNRAPIVTIPSYNK